MRSRYYSFYPSAVETDVAFTHQVDLLCREIGERGKAKLTVDRVSEGVPPAPASTPAPAPAPQASAPARDRALAPAPAPAPATPVLISTAPEPSFSPRMQMTTAPTQPVGSVGLAEVASLFKEQQTLLLERDEKARAEMDTRLETQRAEMRAEMEKQRQELTPAPPQEAISAGQLAALQARLQAMNQAKLLDEEELFALEDLCADFAELKSISVGGVMTKEMVLASPALVAAATLCKLVGVSEQIAGDAAFARQVRRKFVSK